jgi:hypothetical protein
MKFRDMLNGVGVIDLTPIQKTDFTDVKEALNEAAFSEKNLEKVAVLYAKILSKRMGGVFSKLGFESYKRKRGPGRGIRFMSEKGKQLRFNYDLKIAKKGNYELTSIDYWDERNTNLQNPTRTILLPSDLNVVQILDKVADGLLTGRINESELNEARTGDEKRQWLASKGLPKSLAGSVKGMRARAEKEGLLQELEVFLGESESNTLEESLQQTEQTFSKEVYADPETVFEDIEDLLSVVAQRKWRTLIVCGMGGVGKCLQGEQAVNIKGLEF